MEIKRKGRSRVEGLGGWGSRDEWVEGWVLGVRGWRLTGRGV